MPVEFEVLEKGKSFTEALQALLKPMMVRQTYFLEDTLVSTVEISALDPMDTLMRLAAGETNIQRVGYFETITLYRGRSKGKLQTRTKEQALRNHVECEVALGNYCNNKPTTIIEGDPATKTGYRIIIDI